MMAAMNRNAHDSEWSSNIGPVVWDKILQSYFNFIKGIIDSKDYLLNISLEINYIPFHMFFLLHLT